MSTTLTQVSALLLNLLLFLLMNFKFPMHFNRFCGALDFSLFVNMELMHLNTSLDASGVIPPFPKGSV